MIVIIAVKMTVDRPSGFSSLDHRVKFAAHQALFQRPGVIDVWIPEGNGGPTDFIVKIEDSPSPAGKFLLVATLASELEKPAVARIVYAEDGGWKSEIVTMKFEIAS